MDNISIIEQTIIRMEENGKDLFTNQEKELVSIIAFKTGDWKAVEDMIVQMEATPEQTMSIIQHYEVYMDHGPEWMDQLEKLLVQLEICRVREKYLIENMAMIYDVYKEEIEESLSESKETESVSEKNDKKEEDKNYVTGNSRSSSDHPRRI